MHVCKHAMPLEGDGLNQAATLLRRLFWRVVTDQEPHDGRRPGKSARAEDGEAQAEGAAGRKVARVESMDSSDISSDGLEGLTQVGGTTGGAGATAGLTDSATAGLTDSATKETVSRKENCF